MGTYDSSKLSGLSGRIGPVIFYVTKNGKQVFRHYVKPTDPRTPAQRANRARFGLANKSLSPLNNVIKRGHPGVPNAYRVALGLACREAIAGEYPDYTFNYSKIQVASGGLPLPGDIRMEYHRRAREATFTWDPRLPDGLRTGKGNDRVFVVCFNTALPLEVKTLQRGFRSAGHASLPLPRKWRPAATCFWLYLTAYNFENLSNSVFFALS